MTVLRQGSAGEPATPSNAMVRVPLRHDPRPFYEPLSCGKGQAEPHPVHWDAFDVWLADARGCGVRAAETFAAGLEQDGAAIRAATLP